MAYINGTDADNTIDTDAYPASYEVNFIYGRGGNDIVYGGKLTDFIWGGVGNDSLYGREGSDFLYGEDGNDQLLAVPAPMNSTQAMDPTWPMAGRAVTNSFWMATVRSRLTAMKGMTCFVPVAVRI